jgi:predicted DNA-binding transcriptional regulator AlpA
MRKLVGGLDGLRARGITYTTQYILRLEKRGLFPRRKKQGSLAKNSRFDWFEDEIDAYLDDPAAWRASHEAREQTDAA